MIVLAVGIEEKDKGACDDEEDALVLDKEEAVEFEALVVLAAGVEAEKVGFGVGRVPTLEDKACDDEEAA